LKTGKQTIYNLEESNAIVIQNLTKRYTVNGKDFLALKNINHIIRKGELLGIIGVNGAGKSTLLKILADILTPSEGSITLNGTLLSVLEVGSGFHKDLSGHDNIYFNAALHGKTEKEIAVIYDAIVDFSGIKPFIHEPVKNYSNGMYLRLALSIVLFLDFDILLLDEVINVGDADFRNKSMQFILNKVKQGKTCILVSHDINAIANICNTCIVLENGAIAFRGTSKLAIEEYMKHINASANPLNQLPIHHTLCSLESIALDQNSYTNEQQAKLSITYTSKTTESIYVVFVLKNSFGRLITDSELFRYNGEEMAIGAYEVSCILPIYLLNVGIYSLDIFLTNKEERLLGIENAIHFEIVADKNTEIRPWHKITEFVPMQTKCKWVVKSISSF
jgi:ABC-type polysaccharide/polyol phosphate transport system ATPase subunit